MAGSQILSSRAPLKSRTCLCLYASQIEFLERLSADIRARTGQRVSKRAVIEMLVGALPAARIRLQEV